MNIALIKEITARKIFRISLPLMISALSSHFMMILDQLVLARYSIDSMIGASSASTWCGALQLAAISTTMIAGSFVGNYNGAEKFKLASIPVWQMIWFSLLLFSISIPLSIFAGDICIPDNLKSEGIPYFKVMMFATPLYGIYYSLASFFVAIGKGFLVTISLLIADIILVFGYFGITDFQGSFGAAIGTAVAILINISFLFTFYFSKKIREKYDTFNLKLRFEKMKECLKLGLAGGISHMIEMASWSVVYYLLASVAKEEAMIQSIAVSVSLFMAFIISGLEQGSMALSSNFLGAKERIKIDQVLKKALLIHFIFAFIIICVFKFFPEFIVNNFIRFDIDAETFNRATSILMLVALYFLIDGIVWIISGILTGGGDINYKMITIALALWVFVALPCYLFFKFEILSVEKTWQLLCVSVFAIGLALYHRYRSDKWIHIEV